MVSRVDSISIALLRNCYTVARCPWFDLSNSCRFIDDICDGETEKKPFRQGRFHVCNIALIAAGRLCERDSYAEISLCGRQSKYLGEGLGKGGGVCLGRGSWHYLKILLALSGASLWPG